MPYYKIVAKYPKIGIVINTNDNVDYARIKRQQELEKLFDLIFEFSKNYELPILNVLSIIYQQQANNIDNQDFNERIESIKKEISKSNFKCTMEFLYFNDFVLEKAREDIYSDLNLVLPNRFESQYFFESLDDCIKYNNGLSKNRSYKVIEVEFIETNNILKADNTLLTNFNNNFNSNHFYNQARDFLLKKPTESSLFEIVFTGKYKVIKHLSIKKPAANSGFMKWLGSVFIGNGQ